MKLVGCDWTTLKNHIESQFLKGMNWTNREHWHIDHIEPLASAGSEEALMQLCHFSNLRPMWADENLKKGSKAVTHQPELRIQLV